MRTNAVVLIGGLGFAHLDVCWRAPSRTLDSADGRNAHGKRMAKTDTMTSVPAALCARIERVVQETQFSGVVHVSYLDQHPWVMALGHADRGRGAPNTAETLFAIASGTKTLTALAVLSLIAEGKLAFDSEVHDLLGDAADVVQPGVTVRQLLAHTSGMGDYLDEPTIADIEDYALEVPNDELTAPADYLPLLRRRPSKFPPGTGFSYCNSGYVLLSNLIEKVSHRSYYDLIAARVGVPAGASTISFCRLDHLPPRAAVGYLPAKGWCSNQHQLPVRGAGDGGAYATAGDIARLWWAIITGRIVPLPLVEEMLRPQHDNEVGHHRYGLGLWLARDREAVFMEGADAGISFRSTLERSTGLVWTVMSNTTRGAWPVVREIDGAMVELVAGKSRWNGSSASVRATSAAAR